MENVTKLLKMSIKSFANFFVYMFLAFKEIAGIGMRFILKSISRFPKAVLFVFVSLIIVFHIVYNGKVRAMKYAVNKSKYQTELYKDSLENIMEVIR